MTPLNRWPVFFLVAALAFTQAVAAQPEAEEVEATEQAIEQQLTDYLEAVGQVMLAQDAPGMCAYLDVRAVLANTQAQSLLPPRDEEDDAAYFSEMLPQIATMIAGEEAGFGFSAVAIRQVVDLDGLLVVSGTHVPMPGLSVRMRWWLAPDAEAGFLIHDVEFVDDAIRLSTMLGCRLALAAPQPDADLAEDVAHLLIAMDLHHQYEYDAMEEALASVDPEGLPDVLARLCLTLRGAAALGLRPNEGDAIDPLKAAIAGEGLAPPIAHLLLAKASNWSLQIPLALDAIEEFEQRFGVDAESLQERGFSHEMQGDTDRGWQCYWAGLDMAPQDGWALYYLASIVDNQQVEAFNERYARLEDIESWFQVMLQTAEEEDDVVRLRVITRAHRLAFPDDPMLEDAADILIELQGD